MVIIFSGTQRGTWTLTALQPPDFESSMSTNSIIWAWIKFDCILFQMNVYQFSRPAGFNLVEIYITTFVNFSQYLNIIWAWTNFDCFVFQMNVHQFSRSAGFFLPEIFCTMFENFSISRTSSGRDTIYITTRTYSIYIIFFIYNFNIFLFYSKIHIFYY